MLIDTHTHLTCNAFKSPVAQVLQEMKESGVGAVVEIGCGLEDSKKAIALSRQQNNVYAVIGLSPFEAEKYSPAFEAFAKENAKSIVGIGEIGLDYYWFKDNHETQKQVFEKQIKLAHELGLPIIIHSREAMADTIEVLNKNRNYIKHGGIFHCFSGTYNDYLQLNQLGLKFAFGGAITFKSNTAGAEAAKQIPLQDIVLETDCPYLTPVPFRGKENQPKYLPFVAQKLAELKEISVEEVVNQTTKNATEIFKGIHAKF